MRAVLLLSLCLSLSAYAQDIYRWTDSDGVEHFTDDPSQVPKGIKPKKTSGAAISTISVDGKSSSNVSIEGEEEEAKPDAKALAKSEAEWRGKFQQARAKIAELEKQIAADKEIVEPAGLRTSGKYVCYSGNYDVITRRWGPTACGLMLPDAQFLETQERLERGRAELKLWQQRLKELEFAAANAAIPQSWRE